MNRKLAACMLSLILGTIITANANAFVAGLFGGDVGKDLVALCNLIPDGSTALKIAKTACL
ncbi:hypothetical protein [Xenorhabdus doucetiae]|uniref:Uncharacterized protein n=1 Tax=Xenorhabdus doucetiae TaxID=351671 RepID=A0A068QST5_9GAMM|nr:hypothetical protein [Xenorhabdus doucetiae]TYP11621.1 hypothetical protein LY16_00978 [Xenorhabdus doucetiae]CDG17691.1 exported protein of unknown function [Xenorhabdus doucetiae]